MADYGGDDAVTCCILCALVWMHNQGTTASEVICNWITRTPLNNNSHVETITRRWRNWRKRGGRKRIKNRLRAKRREDKKTGKRKGGRPVIRKEGRTKRIRVKRKKSIKRKWQKTERGGVRKMTGTKRKKRSRRRRPQSRRKHAQQAMKKERKKNRWIVDMRSNC